MQRQENKCLKVVYLWLLEDSALASIPFKISEDEEIKLAKAIARLDNRGSTYLFYHLIMGDSISDIVRRFEVNHGTVSSKLKQVRDILRYKLGICQYSDYKDLCDLGLSYDLFKILFRNYIRHVSDLEYFLKKNNMDVFKIRGIGKSRGKRLQEELTRCGIL